MRKIRLVAAQNDLYAQWLGYLQNRISLYRDMGVMPIDSEGNLGRKRNQ